MNDPWFTWLHPFSLLVIRIDELLDDESDLLLGEVEHLLRGVHSLLRPSEDGDGFARSDYEAMQREPHVLFAHIEVKNYSLRSPPNLHTTVRHKVVVGPATRL